MLFVERVWTRLIVQGNSQDFRLMAEKENLFEHANAQEGFSSQIIS